MATRRMFSIRLINSARFLRMPISSQALYFHLGLHADDDGVVEAYPIIKTVGCTEDDLRVLVTKGFVNVLNDDLVTYITDWNEHNKIRADRKIDSIYKDLLLELVPDAHLLEKKPRADRLGTDKGQPRDNQGSAEDRLGKVRLSKDSLDKGRPVKDRLGEDNSGNSCGNNAVDFLELLTDEEIDYLKTIYEDVYELMDEAGADATKKRKTIEEPFSYLIGYATNKGWLEK